MQGVLLFPTKEAESDLSNLEQDHKDLLNKNLPYFNPDHKRMLCSVNGIEIMQNRVKSGFNWFDTNWDCYLDTISKSKRYYNKSNNILINEIVINILSQFVFNDHLHNKYLYSTNLVPVRIRLKKHGKFLKIFFSSLISAYIYEGAEHDPKALKPSHEGDPFGFCITFVKQKHSQRFIFYNKGSYFFFKLARDLVIKRLSPKNNYDDLFNLTSILATPISSTSIGNQDFGYLYRSFCNQEYRAPENYNNPLLPLVQNMGMFDILLQQKSPFFDYRSKRDSIFPFLFTDDPKALIEKYTGIKYNRNISWFIEESLKENSLGTTIESIKSIALIQPVVKQGDIMEAIRSHEDSLKIIKLLNDNWRIRTHFTSWRQLMLNSELFNNFSMSKLIRLMLVEPMNLNSNLHHYVGDAARMLGQIKAHDIDPEKDIRPKDIRSTKDYHDKIVQAYNTIKDKPVPIDPKPYENLPDHVLTNYKVVIPTDTNQIREWGKTQGHCLGSYAQQCINNPNILIIGFSDVDDKTWLGHMMIVNSNLNVKKPEYRVSQFYGKYNRAIPPNIRQPICDSILNALNTKDEEEPAPVA